MQLPQEANGWGSETGSLGRRCIPLILQRGCASVSGVRKRLRECYEMAMMRCWPLGRP